MLIPKRVLVDLYSHLTPKVHYLDFNFSIQQTFHKLKKISNGVLFTFKESDSLLAFNAIQIVVNDLSGPTSLQKYLRVYLAGLPGVKYDTLVVNQTTITQEKIPAVRVNFKLVLGTLISESQYYTSLSRIILQILFSIILGIKPLKIT